MLQWMGGSRRKVNTTRKSTYNRQKQYFEQKKRRQQTLDQEIYEDGQDKQVHYNEEPRSLDILSLSNLTSAPLCCSSFSTGDDAPKVGSDASKSIPSLPSNKTFPIQCVQSVDIRSQLNSYNEARTQKKLPVVFSPGKKQATHDCSNKGGDTLEQQKMQTSSNDSNPNQYGARKEHTGMPQNHVSVLDLLNDDGYQNDSEGRSTQEAHVAFSVEGLGKIGMGTPIHSPRQTVRVSFGEYSPPKASRWINTSNTSEKFKFMSDEGFGISLHESHSELLGKSNIMKKHLDDSTSTNFSISKLKHCDGFSNSTSKFSTKKDIYNPEVCRKERAQNGGSVPQDGRDTMASVLECNLFEQQYYPELMHNHVSFSDYDRFGLFENFLEERESDAAWNDRPIYINRQSNDFEDFYWQDGRTTTEVCKRFNLSEPHAPCFSHLRPDKDQELMSFDWERYPLVNQALHFENATDPPAWCFPETKDAADSLTFLSDESCFFRAVGHHRTISSRSKSKNQERIDFIHQCRPLRRSERKYDMKNLSADRVIFENLDYLQESVVEEENYKKFPNQWRSEQENHWNEPSVNDGISNTDWCLFDGPDLDSVRSPSPRTSQTDGAFFNYGLLPNDNSLEVFENSAVRPSKDFSHRGSKLNIPVRRDPSAELYFEMHSVKQKAGPVNLMKSPKIYPCKPKDEIPFSSCPENYKKSKFTGTSVGQNVEKVDDDESGHLSTTCREASQEAHDKSSIGENGSSSKTVRASRATSNYTNHEEVNHEAPEESMSPNAENSLQSVETSMAKEEASADQKFFVSNKQIDIDGHNPAPSQGDEGKENIKSKKQKVGSKEGCAANSSYQVMLESYVLQLLCVQQVLMDSSEHDEAKKI